MPRIAPSLLSANFVRLTDEIEALEQAGADWLHLDVMDGHFVPNLTFGPPVIQSIKAVTDLPLDVHLMVSNPDDLLEAYVEAGSQYLTVHAETCLHLHRTIQRIRKLGACPGVAINPATPILAVKEILADVDLVLVMTVNPGFGGQLLLPTQLNKVRRLRQITHDENFTFLISVDGGITPKNAGDVREAGADILVAGSAVFRQEDYEQAIKGLRAAR